MINFPDNESELLACFLVSKLDTTTSSYIQPEVQALIQMVSWWIGNDSCKSESERRKFKGNYMHVIMRSLSCKMT